MAGGEIARRAGQGAASHPEIRERLRHRLSQLLARTGKIEADLRRPGDRDWPERAVERQNDEVLEQLGETERGELAEIRAALARLAAGKYGCCGVCAEPIAEKRLRALPATLYCAACARGAGSSSTPSG